jgi:predicted dinucleotide-binding enzyme
MQVAVMGTGTVGRAVAARLDELGHAVTVGTRDPKATMARDEPDSFGNPPFPVWADQHPDVGVVTYREAAATAELIVNATNGAASIAVLEEAGEEHLDGKVLIDIANALDSSRGMPPVLSVHNDDSLGERIQRRFPQSKVVKALNTMNANLMVDPAQLAGGDHTVFVSATTATPRRRSWHCSSRSDGPTSSTSATSPPPEAPRCTCRCGSGCGQR